MTPGRAGPLRVGYQGAPGAFSEQAIQECMAEAVTAVACETFDDLGRDVEARRLAFGLLPVENTLAGSVGASYDVLVTRCLEIVAEVVMPIRHCVVGVRGSKMSQLRRIISHPVALAQCKRLFLSNRHIEAVADYDTAGAAQKVAAMADPTIAAIAAGGVAERYDLAVLARGVEDRADNQTRFFLVGRPGADALPPLRSPATPHRAAIVAQVPNEPGALAAILAPIGHAGINLSKIEGRPAAEPWSYHFVLEMDTPGPDDGVADVVERMACAGGVRVLGRFSRWTVPAGLH